MPSPSISTMPKKRQPCYESGDEIISPKRLSPKTPSRLIACIKISDTHEDNVSENHSRTPRRLFSGKDKTKLAYSVLNSALPISLPGREKEMNILKAFLDYHYDHGTSGSIYVSGPPGSGKTATLSIILSQSKMKTNFKQVYLNCTSLSTSNSLYTRIIEELGLQKKLLSGRKCIDVISEYWVTSKIMTLLVLDEIDQLENRKQSILYTVFEWCSIKNSKLVLIGIANALDLTDRALPRLQGTLALVPTLLHFHAYTKQQLVDIILHRLKEAEVDHIFPESAIALLSAKVAAVSGDARRALDIARRVINVAENKATLGSENQLQIQLTDVLSVINNVYGTSSVLSNRNQNIATDDVNNDNAFPLQHKLIICSLLLLLKKIKSKDDLTIGKLHDAYKNVCQKRNLSVLDMSQFISACSLIETRGIFVIRGKIRNRLSKINLQWDQKEITAELQDKTLLADILSNRL